MAKQTTAARPGAAKQDQSDSQQEPGADGGDAPADTVAFITGRTRDKAATRPAPQADDTPKDGPKGGPKNETGDANAESDTPDTPARRRRNQAQGGVRARGERTPAIGKRAAPKKRAKPSAPSPEGNTSQPAPEKPEVKPVAGPARMKRRHWGVITSWAVLVLVPWLAAVSYLFVVAEDQYGSVSGFTVRSQDQGGANDLLSGLVSFAGGSTASESDILYEFIQSQEMVQSVADQIDLKAHYAQYWPSDWVFSIWPDATQEELIWYWNRMVKVSYDSGTGLIRVQVKAFAPQTAQDINRAIVNESQARINALNLKARQDAMRYAQADLQDAVELLKDAREALTRFRTRTQIVDPETDIQTRMGVMSSLQQQLANALVDYDLLQGTTGQNDPRLKELRKRIDVIRERIATERRDFATSSTETGGISQDYPTLIAEYERLKVDQSYAEESYIAALKALESARDEAARQSRYLATYINPTRAHQAEYPQRFVLSGLIGLFLLLTWSIGVLVYYSIRDRA